MNQDNYVTHLLRIPCQYSAVLRASLMLLVACISVLLIASEPLALLAFAIFMSGISFYSRAAAILTLTVTSLLSVFYWLYLSYVLNLDFYMSSSYWAIIKAALVFPIIIAILACSNFKLSSTDTSYKYFFFFVLILLASLVKGLKTDAFVSVAYFVNVYFPFLLQFLLISWCCSYLLKAKHCAQVRYHGSPLFKLIIAVVLFISLFFMSLQIAFDFSLNEVFLDIGKTLGRGGAEGNNRTILFGMFFMRFPGVFADPILAAYSFFLFFSYIYYFVKNPALKLSGLVICILLAAATLSKAFFFLLACFLAINICLRLKVSGTTKYRLSLFAVGCAVIIISLRALQSGVTDSSAIHVQGLVLPFITFDSWLNFFIGHDLGTGGNMGGWVNQGAESFVGLVMYNTGILGLFFLVMFCLTILKKAVLSKTRIGYFLFATSASILSASFLQENSFNLSFSVLRICCYALVLYFLIGVSKSNEH